MGLPYTQLDATARGIRLIALHSVPSPDNNGVDPVICDIFTASLNHSPIYEALSYTWGDPNLRSNISFNGSLVSVTANLAKALRDIRHIEVIQATRILWVDAICTNQDDLKERNEQVRMMGDIYRRAEQVLSWLGPFDAGLGVTSGPEDLLLDRFFEDSPNVFGKDGITSDESVKEAWAVAYINSPESEAIWGPHSKHC
jgi:hypothetical protein